MYIYELDEKNTTILYEFEKFYLINKNIYINIYINKFRSN